MLYARVAQRSERTAVTAFLSCKKETLGKERTSGAEETVRSEVRIFPRALPFPFVKRKSRLKEKQLAEASLLEYSREIADEKD